MERSLGNWGLWFLFLFVLDFSIPFLVFHNRPTLAGSFLFWTVWVVIAIISMFAIFLRWRDAGDTPEREPN